MAGIVRTIDSLGRVVIPSEIRRTFGIGPGTPLRITLEAEGKIVLSRFEDEIEGLTHMLRAAVESEGETQDELLRHIEAIEEIVKGEK